MKKIILLTITMLFLLTACGGETPADKEEQTGDQTTVETNSGSEAVDFEEIAVEYFEEMKNGEFENVEAAYTDEVAAALAKGKLEEAFAQVIGESAVGEIYESRAEESGEYIVVTIHAILDKRSLICTLVFDENEKIAGINLNYGELPTETEETVAYTEEAIEVGEYELAGVLTIPKNVENPKIAVLIQGSGSTGMDCVIGQAGNAVFRDIAHGLAERGVAVIRFDKRYYSYPELASDGLTIFNESIDDVNSAIKMASEDGRFGEIYIIGHSQGGMIAPYISESNENVAGFIALAGTPRHLEDVILDQNVDALKAANYSEEDIETALKSVKEDISKIKNLKGDEEGMTLITIDSGYWYSLNQTTGEDIASSFDCRALIMQGDKDFQVNSEKDFGLWKELLADKENVEFKLYEGLNHLFMPSDGTMNITEYDKAANVDDSVIADMADWILQR